MAEGTDPLFTNFRTGTPMQVPTSGIEDGAVTTPKLADGAVTEIKIATSAVATDKIATAAVTNPKLADMVAWTIKMRNNASSGVPQDQTINDLTNETSIDGLLDYAPIWDGSAAVMRKALISNIAQAGGLQLLASGTVAAATLDILLTSFTAYRGFVIVLSGFLPATDATILYLRFSTDGGATYDATGYNYAFGEFDDAGAAVTTVGNASGSAAQIQLSNNNIGNGSAEGYNSVITLLNPSSTAFWSRVTHNGAFIDSSATPRLRGVYGAGSREAAQDTNAVRFLFSSGDIAAGNYALYGYR